MGELPDHLWCAEFYKQRLKEARVDSSKTYLSLLLWIALNNEAGRQAELGTTQQELAALLRQHGDHLRAQVAAGNVAIVADYWTHVLLFKEEPWDQIVGISLQEAKGWIETWATHLFAGLDANHTENAVRILLIPGYRDLWWDTVLGVGASQKIAESAINWARAAYAYLLRDDIPPAEAIDKVGMLLTDFVINRYHRDTLESLRPIYPHLGFTCDEAVGRYHELLKQAR